MNHSREPDRRIFLKAAAVGAVATALPWGMRRAPAVEPEAGVSLAPQTRNPADVQRAIRGPILSVPTPFTSDYMVDYDGVRRMIDGALAHGIGVFSLTAGNSYYHALSYDEIKELTRVMVEAVDGRGVTIAAADLWWTDRTLDYARFARGVGADAVQLMLPTRTDQAGQLDYFHQVADATGMGIVLHGDYSIALLEELTAIDAVIALKEDTTLLDYIERQRKFGDRLVVFAGGPKSRFLMAQPYGATAFYSLFSTFAPQVPERFWGAVQKDDLKTAYEIVNQYEFPFFERWSHGMWHASLEHFGVAQRYLRPPEKTFTDAQMKEVAAFFDQLGLTREG